MTLRRYAHVLEDMREDVGGRAMDNLFWGTSSPIQIPRFHRTLELGFHALLTEGTARQVVLVRA
jgi:hypothetical protein